MAAVPRRREGERQRQLRRCRDPSGGGRNGEGQSMLQQLPDIRAISLVPFVNGYLAIDSVIRFQARRKKEELTSNRVVQLRRN